MKLFKTMTVDPGFDGTGWAMWDGGDGPEYTGVIRLKPKEKEGRKWWENALSISNQFYATLCMFKILDVVYLEYPELWTGSAKSMASGARGDLFMLTYLVGSLGAAVYEYDSRLELTTPSDWKGQLPKDVVKRRIAMVLNKQYKNHEEDAVGMGLALMKTL